MTTIATPQDATSTTTARRGGGHARHDAPSVMGTRWRALQVEPERGAGLPVLAAYFVLAAVVMMGLVVDGGAKASLLNQADAIAQEAARAGVQAAAVDGNGATVDVGRGVGAAQAYLADARVSGAATASGPDGVAVTVSLSEPTQVLSIIMIGEVRATGEATAQVVYAGG